MRNQATQPEVTGGQASSVFAVVPHHWHYYLSSTSCQISSSVVNVMLLNHPGHSHLPYPQHLWKNGLPRNQALLLKQLGTAELNESQSHADQRSLTQKTKYCMISLILLEKVSVIYAPQNKRPYQWLPWRMEA